MPDISMCEGKECPLKENCRRYKIRPSEYRQSYFVGIPYKDGKCEYYWPLKKELKKEKVEEK